MREKTGNDEGAILSHMERQPVAISTVNAVSAIPAVRTRRRHTAHTAH